MTEYEFPGIRPPTHGRQVTFSTELSSNVPLSLQAAASDTCNSYSNRVSTGYFETPLEYSFCNMNPFQISSCRPSTVEGVMQNYPSVRRKMNTETLPTYTFQRGQHSVSNLPMSMHHLMPDFLPGASSSVQHQREVENISLTN